MNKRQSPTARKLSSLATHNARLSQDVIIQGIQDNSSKIQTGDAFLCLPRAGEAAQKYINTAQERGAAAIILVGHNLTPKLPHMFLANMQAAGRMLRRWFKTEHSQVKLVGITGTDGKTSITWMLREAMNRLGKKTWSVGTLGYICDADHIDLGNTTPSLLKMHQIYAHASQANVDTLVCEISSHGIEQQRIAGLEFHAAVWTNLGHDHLDDHGSFERYANIKAHFLQQTAHQEGVIIANQDCSDVVRFAPHNIQWYGKGLYRQNLNMAWEQEIPSMLRLKSHDGTSKNKEIVIEDIPLGDFHAENTAAVAIVLQQAFQVKTNQFPALLNRISAPPGRLQPIGLGSYHAFVDYAHTPEALERCLKTVRYLCHKELYLVFGCGGNRDKDKRPSMGRIAAQLADHIWLTSDNPRSEDPQNIIGDILTGIPKNHHQRIHTQTNRRTAIAQAVHALKHGDTLLIVGKGHENYMEINDQRIQWSDQDIATSYLRQKQRKLTL